MDDQTDNPETVSADEISATYGEGVRNSPVGKHIEQNVLEGKFDNRGGNIVLKQTVYQIGLPTLLMPIIEKRRNEWLNELEQGLANLQQQTGISLEDLVGSDSFTDTVLQATQLALKTRSKEKREALRNAITNSVLPNAPDDILQHMFLTFIDEFTPWHLLVLRIFTGSTTIKKNSEERLLDIKRFDTLEGVVEWRYPELIGISYFLLRDLIFRELLDDSNEDAFTNRVNIFMPPFQVYKCTTELGDQFLKFIDSPF